MRLPLLLSTSLLFSSVSLAQTPAAAPKARLLTLSVQPAATTRPRRVSDVTVPSSAVNQIEQRAFENTNAVRVRSGLAPLVWNNTLWQAARIHSENMVRRGYFAHETPEGLSLRDRMRAVGLAHFQVLGENIAYNQ